MSKLAFQTKFTDVTAQNSCHETRCYTFSKNAIPFQVTSIVLSIIFMLLHIKNEYVNMSESFALSGGKKLFCELPKKITLNSKLNPIFIYF